MRPEIVTERDLHAVVCDALGASDPAGGCWLCRNDDRGFMPSAEAHMQLQRIVVELSVVKANVPPRVGTDTIEAITQFCSQIPPESALFNAAWRLKDSLALFYPWVERRELLHAVRESTAKQVPHKALIYAKTLREAGLAQLATGCIITDIVTPTEAATIINTKWAVIVAVNFTPDELLADLGLATVGAQRWMCWALDDV